jgi:hypothetical protein
MSKAQTLKISGLALLGLFAVFAVWKWNDWRASAQAGSAYAARITCSCRFVEGRSAKSCADDIAEDASAVTITEDIREKRIIGSVPLLGRASAKLTPGFGCLMELR